jgi:hypothetical protein
VRDRYAASPLARWLLPSNGLGVNHTENTAPVFLKVCLFQRVYQATGFSSKSVTLNHNKLLLQMINSHFLTTLHSKTDIPVVLKQNSGLNLRGS